jgi:hypothetical protein
VVRRFEGGFAVRILASLYKRERMVNLLTWLVNQETLGLTEERRHERIVPRVNASKLILPDGAVHNCRVIDVSLSGASVACTVKPEIGTMVILGRMRGRVVTMSKGSPSNSPSSRTPTASPAPSARPAPPPTRLVGLEGAKISPKTRFVLKLVKILDNAGTFRFE